MDWKLDKSRAICPQIYDRICAEVASGKLSPDEKIQSVREMALLLGVNPNTVQKAYEALDREGILYSVRGSGWFVGKDTGVSKDHLEDILWQKTSDYFKEMKALGMDAEAVKKYVEEWYE